MRRAIHIVKVTLMKKDERSLVPSGMATILPRPVRWMRRLEYERLTISNRMSAGAIMMRWR